MSKPKYALSIRQPWAWLIVAGHKTWENREWPKNYPALLFLKHHLIGQRIYIHASKGMTRREYEEAKWIFGLNDFAQFDALKRGGIVGEATIAGWRDEADKKNRFSFGSGIVLKDARATDFIPCAGKLGFFIPPL
ncbi:MAG: ASCH domain-containing protein [Undibacterium sp.]